jgi:hypothetical protein
MRVEVVHLEKSTGMIHLQLPGQTMPYTDAPIFAQTSGYLKKWYFEIGSASDTGEQHWLQCARGGRVRCGRADACRGQPWRRRLGRICLRSNIPFGNDACKRAILVYNAVGANRASITARIAACWLCTTSRKASTVGDDGAARRQLIRNSRGTEAG